MDKNPVNLLKYTTDIFLLFIVTYVMHIHNSYSDTFSSFQAQLY